MEEEKSNMNNLLLDWINTIDDPKCLILANLEGVRDGNVILRIVYSILKKVKKEKEFELDWEEIELISANERFEIAFSMLSNFTDEKNIRENFSFATLTKSNQKLFDFVAFIKKIYENPYDHEVTSNTELPASSYYLPENFNKQNTEYMNYPNHEGLPKTEISFCNKNKGYNFRDLNLPKKEIVNKNIENKQIKPQNLSDEKINFIRNIPNKVDYNQNNFVNKVTENKSRNVSNENRIKRTHSSLSNQYPSNNQIERKTIDHPECGFYSKREIAEIEMFRGKLYSTKIENKGKSIKIMCFLKPSLPCVNCNLDSYSNFLPDSNRAVNSFLLKEVMVPKEQKQNELSPNLFSPVRLKTNEFIYYNKENNEIDEKKSSNGFKEKISSLTNTFYSRRDDLSEFSLTFSQQRSVYDWLIFLGIIKENCISMNDLPRYCDNGLMIADIINRLEGREEVIKGITRNNYSKVQKLININKCLDFLKRYEKINPRHLWNAKFIEEGSPNVIWELLYDIWSFYKNRNRISKSPVKNVRKSIEKKEKYRIEYQSEDKFDESDTKFQENCIKLSRDRPNNYYTDIKIYNRALNNNSSLNDSKLINRTVSQSPTKDKSKNKKTNIPSNKGLQKCILFAKEDCEPAKGNNEFRHKRISTSLTKSVSKTSEGDSLQASYSSIRERSLERRSQFMKIKSPKKVQEKPDLENEFLRKWLNDIGIKLEKKIDFREPIIDEFKNGLLFCNIISKLEGNRIRGINMNPKDLTSCINNVRKGFEILRARKNLPLDYMLTEEDIIKGRGPVIRELLCIIAKAYGVQNRSGTSRSSSVQID